MFLQNKNKNNEDDEETEDDLYISYNVHRVSVENSVLSKNDFIVRKSTQKKIQVDRQYNFRIFTDFYPMKVIS